MDKLIILIADDEKPARNKLKGFISQMDCNADIIEAGDGIEAFEMINNSKPDLLFLDIQMPGMSGLEIIQNLRMGQMPVIVFVTAFDQYAVKAFEHNACDYLLKPFDIDRFNKAFQRAVSKLKSVSENNENIIKLLSELKKGKQFAERFLVNSNGKYFFVPAEEIMYVSAEEKYVALHTEKSKHLMRDTLSAFEEKLNPKKFVRIHRSYIVNTNFIQEIKPWFHGDYVILLRDGMKLNLSRRYKENLFAEYKV